MYLYLCIFENLNASCAMYSSRTSKTKHYYQLRTQLFATLQKVCELLTDFYFLNTSTEMPKLKNGCPHNLKYIT